MSLIINLFTLFLILYWFIFLFTFTENNNFIVLSIYLFIGLLFYQMLFHYITFSKKDKVTDNKEIMYDSILTAFAGTIGYMVYLQLILMTSTCYNANFISLNHYLGKLTNSLFLNTGFTTFMIVFFIGIYKLFHFIIYTTNIY